MGHIAFGNPAEIKVVDEKQEIEFQWPNELISIWGKKSKGLTASYPKL